MRLQGAELALPAGIPTPPEQMSSPSSPLSSSLLSLLFHPAPFRRHTQSISQGGREREAT